MRLLLDECLPLDFRHSFPGHQVHTVQWAGLKGKKNGELLQAAEDAGYDVLLTVDQGIPRQQAFGDRKLSVILIRSRTNQIESVATGARDHECSWVDPVWPNCRSSLLKLIDAALGHKPRLSGPIMMPAQE